MALKPEVYDMSEGWEEKSPEKYPARFRVNVNLAEHLHLLTKLQSTFITKGRALLLVVPLKEFLCHMMIVGEPTNQNCVARKMRGCIPKYRKQHPDPLYKSRLLVGYKNSMKIQDMILKTEEIMAIEGSSGRVFIIERQHMHNLQHGLSVWSLE